MNGLLSTYFFNIYVKFIISKKNGANRNIFMVYCLVLSAILVLIPVILIFSLSFYRVFFFHFN